jgi:predicted  nucleic acid-binding Zn-ribbon protein
MASKITKTLSFRVPVGTYNNLIKEVEKKGGNMTELLCSKIINSEEPTVEKVEIDTTYLENQIISLERALEESKNIINYLEKYLQNNNLQQEYSNLQQNSNIRIRTLESELEAELNSAKVDNDSLRTKIGLLEQNLEKIKQENLSNEAENKALRYFNEIERLTSEVNTLQEKLRASQEQTTYYKALVSKFKSERFDI